MTKEFGMIPMNQWGSDHWSLLGYVAACFDNELNRTRLRCNPERHPLMQHQGGWSDKYSSRLAFGKSIGHDDFDCLDDLEAEGFVIIDSIINCRVSLTEKGNRAAFKLREHKRNGGSFATFTLSEVAAQCI